MEGFNLSERTITFIPDVEDIRFWNGSHTDKRWTKFGWRRNDDGRSRTCGRHTWATLLCVECSVSLINKLCSDMLISMQYLFSAQVRSASCEFPFMKLLLWMNSRAVMVQSTRPIYIALKACALQVRGYPFTALFKNEYLPDTIWKWRILYLC